MELKVCFLGAVRRRTFICCRNVRISASSAARDRNRSTTIQTMCLTRSLIPQQHRPILDQLLVRLSLRQGQCSDGRVDVDHARLRAVIWRIKNVFTRPGSKPGLTPLKWDVCITPRKQTSASYTWEGVRFNPVSRCEVSA